MFIIDVQLLKLLLVSSAFCEHGQSSIRSDVRLVDFIKYILESAVILLEDCAAEHQLFQWIFREEDTLLC